jgi:membrane-associated phospholipid phosphatase
LAAGVLAAGMMLAAALGCNAAVRARLVFFGVCGSVLCAANQAVVYPIKTLWARTRFDDMLAAGSFEAFTPWFRPLGFGGSSFPSGHTANAACILALLVLCDLFPGWGKRRRLVTALCWAFIALMATARIVIGRHFLSDTLAASAIMAGLFYALRHNRFYRKGLRRALERAAQAEHANAV